MKDQLKSFSITIDGFEEGKLFFFKPSLGLKQEEIK